MQHSTRNVSAGYRGWAWRFESNGQTVQRTSNDNASASQVRPIMTQRLFLIASGTSSTTILLPVALSRCARPLVLSQRKHTLVQLVQQKHKRRTSVASEKESVDGDHPIDCSHLTIGICIRFQSCTTTLGCCCRKRKAKLQKRDDGDHPWLDGVASLSKGVSPVVFDGHCRVANTEKQRMRCTWAGIGIERRNTSFWKLASRLEFS